MKKYQNIKVGLDFHDKNSSIARLQVKAELFYPEQTITFKASDYHDSWMFLDIYTFDKIAQTKALVALARLGRRLEDEGLMFRRPSLIGEIGIYQNIDLTGSLSNPDFTPISGLIRDSLRQSGLHVY